ncbi:DNA-binding response regulator [Actinophytocola xinjiangensis]|uniref:DNA-binding response regulator n=1 Tax=Actinophytocola xinjiangensis TaxID=485602 RepID=A0A7Z0WPM1_9PSEU|nr:response regulator transcription factor [Actinophytocola xinjiangensis]OLF12057.1 DNA-binding response regulator [Actinophytocola xinjiangensis]
MRVLVVEDDDGVAASLVGALKSKGHLPDRVARGADALLRHRDADIMLLDLELPDIHGLDVVRKLRKVSPLPLIVITAHGEEHLKVSALNLGADDYLVKPIGLGELVARIRAVTRRAATEAEPGAVTTRDLTIDLPARRVLAGDGREIELTPKEFDVLAVLARHCGVAVSRQQLLDTVWGDAYVTVNRSLDVHMTALRTKLARPGIITTIRGYGYRLEG